MNISISIQAYKESVKAEISGEIDAYTAPELREKLLPYGHQNGVRLYVNLSGVSYMDSTGLGVFVGLFKNIRTNNGELLLSGLSERLKRLFDITGLTDIMEINTEVEGGV